MAGCAEALKTYHAYPQELGLRQGDVIMLDERTAPYGALLLRVLLGFLFWAHLYWKFFVLPGGLCSLGFAGEPARNARG